MPIIIMSLNMFFQSRYALSASLLLLNDITALVLIRSNTPSLLCLHPGSWTWLEKPTQSLWHVHISHDHPCGYTLPAITSCFSGLFSLPLPCTNTSHLLLPPYPTIQALGPYFVEKIEVRKEEQTSTLHPLTDQQHFHIFFLMLIPQ